MIRRIARAIRSRIVSWARCRAPDFVIGGHERPYLRRHWLIPRNRFFNIYVHQFLRSDDDRALRDHPWLFNASWLLEGEYVEHTIPEGGTARREQRRAGDFKFRWGPAPHRVELVEREICAGVPPFAVPCWTVFITGPVVRSWGFYCPRRWVPWQEFTAADDRGAIGRGCDS